MDEGTSRCHTTHANKFTNDFQFPLKRGRTSSLKDRFTLMIKYTL